MYGTVKCLPVSRRKSISDSSPEPVEVVDQDRPVRAGREVEEPLELAADRRDVGLERLAIEQVPLGRAPRRVADHPGPAADQRDRPAPEPLQPEQPEDRDQVADVERVRGRVEADVAGDRPARREPGRQPGRRLVEDAPPLELGQQPGQARGRSRGPSSQARDVESSRPVREAASTVRSRPLCYRAATDADQPRAAPAPPTGARTPTASPIRIDHRTDRRRRPRRDAPHRVAS